MRQVRAFVGLLAGLAAETVSARAERIISSSFFTSIPHRLIDLETDGSGQAVDLNQGVSIPMPAGAYASAGIAFNPAVRWVNDTDADFDAAQAIGGSLDVAVPGPLNHDFVIEFLIPTRAFGFWVVNKRQPAAAPVLEARDETGDTIETAVFVGDAIDGIIGVAEYGFLGIASEEDIASVLITKDAALLDDFRCSPVPEPESVLLVAVAALMLGTRPRFRPES